MTGDQVGILSLIVAIIGLFFAYRQVRLGRRQVHFAKISLDQSSLGDQGSKQKQRDLAPKRLTSEEARDEPGTPIRAFCVSCRTAILTKLPEVHAGLWRCQKCLQINEVQMDQLGRVTIKTVGQAYKTVHRIFQTSHFFHIFWYIHCSEAWFEDHRGRIRHDSYNPSRRTPIAWRREMEDRMKKENTKQGTEGRQANDGTVPGPGANSKAGNTGTARRNRSRSRSRRKKR